MTNSPAALSPIPIQEVYAARQRIQNYISPSPLLQLHLTDVVTEIYLKLENLLPAGSFKLRGVINAMAIAEPYMLEKGVWTVSAGNMGYALAWFARQHGIPCTVIVPEDAPHAKLEAIVQQDAQIEKVPFQVYQEIQQRHSWHGFLDHPPDNPLNGLLIHPFSDRAVMAGNATIGLEILENLPEVEAILVPYGGGGLSCGIASAVKNQQPGVHVLACEIETAAPLAASMAASHPVQISYTPSFVSGIGAPFVFPEMWQLAQQLLDGSLVATLEQVREAIRLLVQRNHIVAEGAGAVSVAAALAGLAGYRRVACVVSGGNIDQQVLINILQERPA